MYFWSALSISYVGIFLPSWFQLAWWFQRRILKCKSLRTTTDAKWWLYIAWPFGSSELIRCYQISHVFRHRGARNVLPTDVKRTVGPSCRYCAHLLIPHFVGIYWILFKILFHLPLVSRVVDLEGVSLELYMEYPRASLHLNTALVRILEKLL